MWSWLGSLLSGFMTGPLDRILTSIDRKVDNETERDKLKTEAVQSYISAQTAILTGRGWWFPLFFIIPTGLWFSSVCIYSVLWCRSCAFPQDWSIAAMPAPLNEWMGWIVGSLFAGKVGEALVSRLRK